MTRPTIKTIIPKGTKIRSTHPSKGCLISKREQVVDNIHTKRDYFIHCDNVEWAGAGGYWRWAKINDEILEANPELKVWIEEKKRKDDDEKRSN